MEDAKLPKTLRKPLKISRSAARQQLYKSVKARWSREWKMLPRYTKLKHIDSSLPSNKFIKLMSNKDICREATGRIYQLHSGHKPLNMYLHRFKLVDSVQCPACGAPREIPQHFVLECPAYKNEWRKTLKPKRGRSKLKSAEILGRKFFHRWIEVSCSGECTELSEAFGAVERGGMGSGVVFSSTLMVGSVCETSDMCVGMRVGDRVEEGGWRT